jgi:hypothetical protein
VILPGDVVSCAGREMLAELIHWQTHSGYSHTQLVVEPAPFPCSRPFDFKVLDVGARIRIARFSDLGYYSYRVDRPKCPAGEHQAAWGELVAGDAKRLVAHLQATNQDRYPWWKLPLYLLPNLDWRGRLIREGPLQVCSVISVRCLVARGWSYYIWNGPDRILVDTHNEIQCVRPSDIVRFAVEGGMQRICESRFAPVI